MTAAPLWLAFWIGLTVTGVAGIVALTNSIRFQWRVIGEARDVLNTSGDSALVNRANLERLPAPVQRYLSKALGRRREEVRTARLRQDGTFRPDLNGAWYPLRADQYFTTDPPGFVWWGRVRLAPGVWIDARDRSVAGSGNMLVKAESTVTLANATGPALDQGALLRTLGELAWMPTAYLDHRYVRWSPIDDTHAKATLVVNGLEVSGVYEFCGDGLPRSFTADRFRDVGDGQSELTPFLGEYRDYREVGGLLVPHQVTGSWIIDGRPAAYARFHVRSIEFDVRQPF